MNTRAIPPLIAVAVVSAAPPSMAQAPPAADMVLLNGKVVTLEPDPGTAEAVAIAGDRILAVGTSAQIERLATAATRRIDLAGRLVIPGFIEGHGHLLGLGQSRQMLDLTTATSWQGIVTMVADAVKSAAPGQWIRGRGWHQEKWQRVPDGAVEGFPRHDDLSAVSPDNPVLLTHASGHASFANQRAMALAGISATTQDPPGGEILRDESGAPVGLFRETAQGLIGAALEAGGGPSRDEEAITIAVRECLSKGVTSFQDAGSSFATIDLLRRMAESGKLPMRVWVMVREPNDALRRRLGEYATWRGLAQHHLTVGGIKRMIDGALGSRGAWLLDPYADSPHSHGLATESVEEIAATAEIAIAHDLQLAVHAIGDRANREVLDLYERAFRAHPQARDLRFRIEHVQHLHPDDIPRFAQLGVIASMQANHCTSDAPWVLARLGEQRAREGAYMWRALLDSGAVVSNGTDTPVEDVDPIACYHAAVTRRLKDGSRFFPEQGMTRMEALRAYTIDAAYAAKEEHLKGTIAPGKLADLVVLSGDILSVPEEQIPDTRVAYTIVGGRIVHEAGAGQPGGQ
jgi:predicted amidohydrolase YtcJ